MERDGQRIGGELLSTNSWTGDDDAVGIVSRDQRWDRFMLRMRWTHTRYLMCNSEPFSDYVYGELLPR